MVYNAIIKNKTLNSDSSSNFSLFFMSEWVNYGLGWKAETLWFLSLWSLQFSWVTWQDCFASVDNVGPWKALHWKMGDVCSFPTVIRVWPWASQFTSEILLTRRLPGKICKFCMQVHVHVFQRRMSIASLASWWSSYNLKDSLRS